MHTEATVRFRRDYGIGGTRLRGGLRQRYGSGKWRGGLDQPAVAGDGDGLAAVGGTEFVEDAADVGLDSTVADEERLGDLLVSQVLGKEAQHIGLARGQTERVGRRRPRRIEAHGEGVGAGERRRRAEWLADLANLREEG